MVFRLSFCAVLVATALGGARLQAYVLTASKWPAASTTMQLQLGSSGTLSDGFTSWGAVAEDALNVWNSNLGGFKFNVVRDSTAPRAQGNRSNNVFFSGNIYGDTWGTGVLAVTLTYMSGSSTVETDVLFNNNLSWNSYRGALRTGVYDFRRVAMHEFGHVLGLDHPDQAGQVVSALMNSRISSLDTVTGDDIAGAQSLYGAPTSTPVIAPPVITAQPVSVTVTAGQSASFSISVSSTAAVTYQWLKNNVTISGATSATYIISATTSTDGGSYTVAVTNGGGLVLSTPATLTVNAATPTVPSTPTVPTPPSLPVAPAAPTVTAPSIATQPSSQTVPLGGTVTFSVSATGSAPFSYQWRKNGSAMSGATSSQLTLGNVSAGDAGTYSVVVTNSVGSVTSLSATLAINSPPTFTLQPSAQTASVGTTVVLSAAASGTPAPTYQWFRDTNALAGATNTELRITSVQLVDAGAYRVVATNSAGSVTSSVAVLAVNAPPRITTGLTAQTVTAGDTFSLSVAATGTPAPNFQWLKDGAEIAGATTATLTIASIAPTDAGTYAVRVTNAAGTVTSSGAVVTVNFSRIINLSTRGFVPNGGALTPGFTLRGTGTKSLVIRAVGPTLSLFGVGSALTEATLDVLAPDSSVIASNKSWGGSATLDTAFTRVGAFPLAADSKDAAVQANLIPQAYTARVQPTQSGTSGITLAEVYDADALTTARLVNVSTLAFVGSGENVLTAGFVVSGNAPKRVLIRAVGPGLAPFGVADRLLDPQLSLVPLGGLPLAANDDWPDLPSVRAAFSTAGAFALTAGSKDAALVISLEPGGYTVVVSGVGAATGNALVEIYDLDP